jgi:hypothetical protein
MMKIKPTMNLDHLTERMWANGDWPADSTAAAQAMRELLLQGQTAYGWRTTSDMEDDEWFALLDEAVSGAAEELRADDALAAAAPDLLAALQWALSQIEDSLDPDHQAALESARAIARATGR